MDFEYKKYIPLLIKIILIGIVGTIIYFISNPLLKTLSPFIIATIFAMIIEPQVRFLQTKLKINRKSASLIALILSLIVFGSILTLAIYKIIIELIILSNAIPEFFKNIDMDNEFKYLTWLTQNFYFSIPKDTTYLLENKLNETFNSISGFITNFITAILGFVLGFIKVLPQSLIFIIITIISTYFISSDKYVIKEFVLRQISRESLDKIQNLKNDLFLALIGFVKAQIIIMLISIILALTGFTVLGIEYAFVMSLIIGLAELLPVIGTGLIFTPWIIFNLYNGNLYVGIGLIAVFLLGVITRQIIEPKIIGKQIGLYPLLTLISIYAGLEVFGVFGMILGPILFIVLKSLNKSKVIKLWK